MMKTKKTMRMVPCVLIAALLGMALTACGTAPARGAGDNVAVPIVGDWFVSDDSGNGGTSTITMTEIEEGGMPAWHFAGEITESFEWGFVQFGFELDDSMREIFTSVEAISFMVRGDGQRYELLLPSTIVRDYGDFAVSFDTVAGEATRLTFPLRLFFQPGWAMPVGRLRSETVTALLWASNYSIRPGAFELEIWDVRLYVPEGTEVPQQ